MWKLRKWSAKRTSIPLAKALIRLFSITATAITLRRNGFKRDRRIAAALDFLIGPEMLKAGDAESLHRLYDELVNKDWFMTLPDFEDYCRIKGHALYDTLSKGCVGGKNAR